jgi:hypothetical protein
MKCCNCLSHSARIEWPQSLEWLVSPVISPVFCNRCLKRYYVLSVQAVSNIVLRRLHIGRHGM